MVPPPIAFDLIMSNPISNYPCITLRKCWTTHNCLKIIQDQCIILRGINKKESHNVNWNSEKKNPGPPVFPDPRHKLMLSIWDWDIQVSWKSIEALLTYQPTNVHQCNKYKIMKNDTQE